MQTKSDYLDQPSEGRFVLRTLAALSLGFVMAFAGNTAMAQTIKDGGTLRAALTGEPDLLDPAISTIYTGAQVYEHIFSKLIDFDGAGNFVPDLATSWEQVDAKTWKFKLVTNATFHNGEPFTSADVKYSFERILNPNDGQRLCRALCADRVGRRDRSGRCRLPSQVAVRAVPQQPRDQRPDRQQEGDRERRSGAQPGRHRSVQVRRMGAGRPHHARRRTRPTSRRGCRISTPSPSASCSSIRAASTRSRPVNSTGSTPSRCSRFRRCSKDPRFTYVTSPVAGIPDFIALNTSLPPFDNPKVRQAVALAINRADIRDVAYAGTGELGPRKCRRVRPGTTLTGILRSRSGRREGQGTPGRSRISQWPHRRISRPAAISGATEDRTGGPRAPQGHRHRHDRSSRSTCRSGTTPSSQHLPDHQRLSGAVDRS